LYLSRRFAGVSEPSSFSTDEKRRLLIPKGDVQRGEKLAGSSPSFEQERRKVEERKKRGRVTSP
jgi:hypothetical protein